MNQAQTWSSTKKIARYSAAIAALQRPKATGATQSLIFALCALLPLLHAKAPLTSRYCWLAQIEDEELSGSSFDGEDDNDMPSDASYDSESE